MKRFKFYSTWNTGFLTDQDISRIMQLVYGDLRFREWFALRFHETVRYRRFEAARYTADWRLCMKGVDYRRIYHIIIIIIVIVACCAYDRVIDLYIFCVTRDSVVRSAAVPRVTFCHLMA
jgi:hypothetical protein